MTEQKRIMSEMQVVEDTLRASMHKVEVIEKKLRTKLLTTDNRDKLERELEDVKNILSNNEMALKDLRQQNTRSFMLAASFVFACFLLFGLYSMIFGGI